MNKKLPPLNSLITFEAAARLNSFKLAADELHQTPAAIAYQIRKLESSLNIKLFDRHHKGVSLNNAGRQYLNTITGLLKELADQTQQFKRNHERSTLTVLTLHAIAEKWLMPRLVDFRGKHPDIHIEINATDNLEMSASSDIIIGFSLDRLKNPAATVFLEEEIFPVCSGDILNNPHIDLQISKLSDHDLLFDAHWKQDWNLWLAKNNASAQLGRSPGVSFSLYSMVIEAAVNGMGIMMGHKQLIRRELQNGSLNRIFNETLPVKGVYYLLKNAQQEVNDVADQFQYWIKQQAQS